MRKRTKVIIIVFEIDQLKSHCESHIDLSQCEIKMKK